MTADESASLMDDYQSGVTAALIGILIARGVMSREEFAGALSIVSSTRDDVRLRALFQPLIDNLLVGQSPPVDARASLELIIGGRSP